MLKIYFLVAKSWLRHLLNIIFIRKLPELNFWDTFLFDFYSPCPIHSFYNENLKFWNASNHLKQRNYSHGAVTICGKDNVGDDVYVFFVPNVICPFGRGSPFKTQLVATSKFLCYGIIIWSFKILKIFSQKLS